jgi:hypothetical protein
LVVACANDPESVGQPANGGAEDVTTHLWFTTSNRDGRGSARDGDDQILQFRP